ncbi:hypothetical protein PN4B1_20370 [Paenibacillus naphthalenovorans]|nr:hypothetical protein PN4B1_20370 [Paenibacillus naphthalenovorans]
MLDVGVGEDNSTVDLSVVVDPVDSVIIGVGGFILVVDASEHALNRNMDTIAINNFFILQYAPLNE